VSIHNGCPFQELQTVQKSQPFIEFLFISLNTSKYLQHGKPNIFIENINFSTYFAASWTLLPRATAPFLPAMQTQTLMDGQRSMENAVINP